MSFGEEKLVLESRLNNQGNLTIIYKMSAHVILTPNFPILTLPTFFFNLIYPNTLKGTSFHYGTMHNTSQKHISITYRKVTSLF